jgi:hypothetical protein
VTDPVREGGCACGALRYRLIGAPLGSMVCHCASCRAIAAAPVVAWLSFGVAQFAWVQGTPADYASSAPVHRQFCNRCGTHLIYRHRDAPDEIDVSTCSLDDPNAFPPTHHSWLSHDLDWVKFGDGLPTYASSRYS